jgi:hypothetical protein
MNMLRRMGVVLAIVLGLTFLASAQQLYISSEGQDSLQLLNIQTSQLTTLYEIGGSADDLTLNAQGQLIYSVPAAGDHQGEHNAGKRSEVGPRS